MRELTFTSVSAACCGVHMNISAKRPSPAHEMGVTIVCVIEKQEVMVRALVEGGLLHAAGLKVGDRILEINNTAEERSQRRRDAERRRRGAADRAEDPTGHRICALIRRHPLQSRTRRGTWTGAASESGPGNESFKPS